MFTQQVEARDCEEIITVDPKQEKPEDSEADKKEEMIYNGWLVNAGKFQLKDIKHSATVEYRVGRLGKTGPVWKPWRVGPLYVQRRSVDLPKKRRSASSNTWKAGSIVSLTTFLSNTADFDEDDYCGNGVFCSEDSCLEIRRLE